MALTADTQHAKASAVNGFVQTGMWEAPGINRLAAIEGHRRSCGSRWPAGLGSVGLLNRCVMASISLYRIRGTAKNDIQRPPVCVALYRLPYATGLSNFDSCGYCSDKALFDR